MAEIILGRLKFKWQGDWTASTAYIKDDIVRHGANTYVATQNHTSTTDFYADLTASKWNLMTPGLEWKGDWIAGAGYANYKINDVVKYSSNLYICIVGHTANSIFEVDLNASRWELLSTGIANRGTWVNSGRYAVNDIVTYGSGIYICIEDHAFDESTDVRPSNSSFWQKLADGMQFDGVWNSATDYQRGDIVRFGGNTYYAKQDSTNVRPGEGYTTYEKIVTVSNPGGYGNKYYIDGVLTPALELYEGNTYVFNQDHVSNASHPMYISTSSNGHFNGGNYNYWLDGVTWYLDDVRMNSFDEYSSGFNTATKRRLVFTVPVGTPKVYPVCANHSGMYDLAGWDTPYSELHWDILNQGFNFVGTYNPLIGFEYKPGEIAVLGGKAYVANKITTASPPGDDWEQLSDGIKYQGDWADNTTYYPGDVVALGGYTYLCVKVTDDKDPPRPTGTEYWSVFTKGTRWRGEWDPRLNFDVGDLVKYGGKTYICIDQTYDDGSTSRTPESGSYFQLFTDGIRWRGEWEGSPIENYRKGDIVRHGGRSYICVVTYDADSSGAGQPPDANWETFSDGFEWKGTWSNSTEYKINDVVEYSQSAYISIAERNLNVTPGTDPTKWSVLAYGDLSSPMTTTGDMIYRNASGATERLPIGDAGSFLVVNNGVPTWGHRTPQNDYYVSIQGDDSNDGRTTGTSWRTLKHACEQTFSLGQCRINVASGVYEEQCPIRVGRGVVLEGNGLGAVTISPNTTRDEGFGVGISDDGSTPNANSYLFHMNNGARMRNFVFRNFSTGSVLVSLDPGYGPDDTSVWITSQSPYVQNCTSFTPGGTGFKIDGALHNGGYRSMVANDWTQINSDGIGIHVLNDGRSEIVSCFTYYCDIGYLAESGGKIRAIVGNNSYGEYGAVARGFSQLESPLTGKLQLTDETINSVSSISSNVHIHVTHRDENGNTYYAGHTNPTGTTVTSTWSNSASYPFIARFNPAGAVEWIYTYESYYGTITVLESIDGEELYVGGIVYKGGVNNGFGMKLSTSGEIQWDKDIGDISSVTAMAVDADDVYFIGDHATDGIGIIKYNPAGAEVWSKTLDYNDSSGANQLVATAAAYTKNPTTSVDTYAAEGDANAERNLYVASYDPISDQALITRLDDNGAYIATYQYPNVRINKLRLDTGNGDGIYFMAAGYYLNPSASGAKNAWAARIDILGNIEWQQQVNTVAEVSEWKDVYPIGNDVYLAGYTYYSSNTVHKGIASRYDSAGTLDWLKEFTNSTNNISFQGITLDGVNVIIGGNEQATAVVVNVQKDVAGDIGTVTTGSYQFISGSLQTPQNTVTDREVNDIDSASLTLGASAVDFTLNQNPTQTRTVNATRAGFAGIGRGINFTIDSLNRQPKPGSVFQILGDSETYFIIGVANYTGPTYTTGNYPNAQYILSQNRTWLQKEVIGYINDTYPSFTYDQLTCERDVGLIVDALVSDLDHNSNGESIDAAFEYYTSGSALVAITTQKTETLAAINYLKTIVGNALNQSAPAQTYTSEPQVTGISPGSEALGITLAQNNTQVIYDILNLGRNAAPAKTNYGACQISIEPSIPSNKTPDDGTFVVFREAFSQVRMSGHDFLDIGTGGFADTNYPVIIAEDYTQKPNQERETLSENGGRVFYVTTDQDGNFRVGDYFKVEQSTGRATLSSEEFDLTGLNELQLGSITAGKQGATINEFSTDGTMADNSDTAVPTERAVVTYVEAQLDERFESFGGTSHIAIPVGTTAQRPNPADTGYFRYNSDNASLEVYGSSGSWEPAGSIRWQVSTTSFTAAKGEGWFVNTSGGAVTVTLPASAAIGDTIRIIDLAGTFDTNNCTINRNGHNIMGLAENLTLSVEHQGVGLVYSNATYGWKLIEVM